MNNYELAAKCKDIALNYKTLYVLGCIGAPLTKANKKRYTQNYAYNKRATRTAMINAASEDTFGFDCVCLIKAIGWGWNGNPKATYGGATYASNGIPDIGADTMIKYCKNVTDNFKTVEIGEALWCKGHIGVYIGGGLAVECTPKWKNCVQITVVGNMNTGNTAYPVRTWTTHGKLPYFNYIKPSNPMSGPVKTNDELANEVIAGKWGTQPGRDKMLADAGYDPKAVQVKVDAIYVALGVLVGDIDGDKRITSADARLALRAAVGLEKLTEMQKMAADVDGDGTITAADARLILRKAVGFQ